MMHYIIIIITEKYTGIYNTPLDDIIMDGYKLFEVQN